MSYADLTRRSSQPPAGVLSDFRVMKQLLVLAKLALASERLSSVSLDLAPFSLGTNRETCDDHEEV